jgi:uncharacterized protein (DUF1330 family)
MLVMLQFDSVGQAHAWHDSPAYQEIIHYRRRRQHQRLAGKRRNARTTIKETP